jgi:chromosome segregation ATPase
MKNAQLRKENSELVDKLATAETELRISARSEEMERIKNQNNSLRKQNQALSEKIGELEAKLIQVESKNGQLVQSIEKYEGNLLRFFACSSIVEVSRKYNGVLEDLRQSQKESSDLRMQGTQMRGLKLESADLQRKVGDLQHNLDFMEARITYIKQVVMQLFTAPFSQRGKVVDVLVDLMSFSPQEKDAILKSPANGKDLSSRLLYAFEPFV